jgi:hypothetical protein
MELYQVVAILIIVAIIAWVTKIRIPPQTHYVVPERGDPASKDLVLQCTYQPEIRT